MQIYYMRKLGMDTGGAGSIIAVKEFGISNYYGVICVGYGVLETTFFRAV